MAKTKAELLADARAAGVTGVSEDNTVAEIQAALDAAPDDGGTGGLQREDDPEAGVHKHPVGEVDEQNRDETGTVIGTEVAPQTETVNASADPHPDYPEGSSHRHAARFGSDANLTATAEDGTKLKWTDPDALPGTIGDDPAETIKAVHAAGGSAVEEVG